MKPPKVTYTDRGLPYLDQPALDFIFDGVYGRDLEQIKDKRFRDFLELLHRMQNYNYAYRQDASIEAGEAVYDIIGPMEQSEGSFFWLGLILALKEWYGLSRSTLRTVMQQVTVRK